MKKLKLKLDGIQEMSKEQMRKINGGYLDCVQVCCSTIDDYYYGWVWASSCGDSNCEAKYGEFVAICHGVSNACQCSNS